MSTGPQLNAGRSFTYTANRETVQLYDVAGVLQGTVPDAKRLGGAIEERLPSHGSYLGYYVDWRLPAANVTVTIQPGFKVKDGRGNTHVILVADNPGSWQHTWNCTCLALGVLGHTVQYSQASCAGSDTDGSRTVTFTNTGDPVAAAIQPMTAALGDQFGTKNFGDSFMIYMVDDPSGTGPTVIDAGDLFIDENGIKYEIVEVSDRMRLEFVSAFRCTKKL